MALVGQRTHREAGIFHYGKVFRVEPKGIFVNKLGGKRVHIKATVKSIDGVVECCSTLCSLWAAMMQKFPNQLTREKKAAETRKLFCFSLLKRHNFYR